jgi:AcrR family transcriptional regulator
MKTIGLRERNKADKLERIKGAAKRLFDQKGYEATTTKEIADAAGVAAGTVFLYAKTKDEILYLIFEEEISRIRDAAIASIDTNTMLIEASYTIFSQMLLYYNQSPELGRAFIRRFVFIDPSMSERYMSHQHETFEQLARIVLAAQERGEMRADIEPLVCVSILWGIYCNSLVFFLQTEPLNIDSTLIDLRRSLDLLFSGLANGSRRSLGH